MLDLEDLFYIVGILAVIITFTLIFLHVLHPPYNAVDVTSTYVNSHIQYCSNNGENIDCLIQRIDTLSEDLSSRFENLVITILIFDSDEREVLYVSREDLRGNELRILQSVSSCNLFRNCPRHYFSYESSNYHIVIS